MATSEVNNITLRIGVKIFGLALWVEIWKINNNQRNGESTKQVMYLKAVIAAGPLLKAYRGRVRLFVYSSLENAHGYGYGL